MLTSKAVVPCQNKITGVFTFTAHEHGSFTARVHGRSRPCTDLVHGNARAVYTAVTSRVHGQRPCTRSVHGGTAVNGRVHFP